jgi:hypothetical protein
LLPLKFRQRPIYDILHERATTAQLLVHSLRLFQIYCWYNTAHRIGPASSPQRTMLGYRISLMVTLGVAQVFSAPPQVALQVPASSTLLYPDSDVVVKGPRKLHGRFLQITDMHPDPYYRAHASQSSSCHRKKPKKEKERSGYYGTPFRLVFS